MKKMFLAVLSSTFLTTNAFATDYTDYTDVKNPDSPWWGAVVAGSDIQGKLIGFPTNAYDDLKFKNNHAKSTDNAAAAGAIYMGLGRPEAWTISSSTFLNNSASSKNSYAFGGAVYNGANNKLSIESSLFEENSAQSSAGDANGGAFDDNGSTTIKYTRFARNFVSTTSGVARGGAIFNNNDAKHNEDTYLSDAIISHSEFIDNYAKTESGEARGGAINSNGLLDINRTVFEGNKAIAIHNSNAFGGAIYNALNTILDANDTHKDTLDINNSFFKDNMANEQKNDIHNIGLLRFTGGGVNEPVAGDDMANLNADWFVGGNELKTQEATSFKPANQSFVVLDGGVSGNDSTSFSNIALFSHIQHNDTSAPLLSQKDIAIDKSKLRLVIDNGLVTQDKPLLLATTADGISGNFNFYNPFYKDELSESAKDLFITKKSAAEIQQAGFNTNQSKFLEALTTVNKNDLSDELNNLTTRIQKGVVANLDDYVPNTESNDRIAIDNALESIGAAAARMSGLSAGDEEEYENLRRSKIAIIPWIRGLYNWAKNTQGQGFKSNTNGYAMGVDVQTLTTISGFGYAQTFTDVKSGGAKTHANGDNMFIYHQYKPDDRYANIILAYGNVDYRNAINTKWDSDVYSGQLIGGKVFGNWDHSLGMRYTHVDNNSYNQSGVRYSPKDADILSAVLGSKYSIDYNLDNGTTLRPYAKAAAVYDIKSSASYTNVDIVGSNSSFQMSGDRLNRLGLEAGTGLIWVCGDSELSLTYDLGLREQYQSHTGMAKFKYNF